MSLGGAVLRQDFHRRCKEWGERLPRGGGQQVILFQELSGGFKPLPVAARLQGKAKQREVEQQPARETTEKKEDKSVIVTIITK